MVWGGPRLLRPGPRIDGALTFNGALLQDPSPTPPPSHPEKCVWGGQGPPSLLLCKQLQAAQARLSYLEQAMVERSIVSRQEALICDLENKMEFQSIQVKRFEVWRW